MFLQWNIILFLFFCIGFLGDDFRYNFLCICGPQNPESFSKYDIRCANLKLHAVQKWCDL